jgi:hypothetical protein
VIKAVGVEKPLSTSLLMKASKREPRVKLLRIALSGRRLPQLPAGDNGLRKARLATALVQ